MEALNAPGNCPHRSFMACAASTARKLCGRFHKIWIMSEPGARVRSGTSPNEAHRLLGNCILFAGLSADERAALAARARIRAFDSGQTIFTIGSRGNQLMALLSGTVCIRIPSSDRKALVLAIIQPGEIFGEIAVLDGKDRSADAVAETACTLAILDRRDILSFLERNPSAWLKLVEVLCQRLRQTNETFAEVALLHLPARLAKTMLRISITESANAQTANIKFSQRELANMLGGSRESVNKCLRKWQRKGIVNISEGSIMITKRAALEDIAEDNLGSAR
jgi:CRP/FNR family transcriptional regulator, cyclic AMP receptor protein